MRMIRKQLYIAPEHQRKLRALAARWQCTEAEVIRTTLDRLPDPEDPIDRRLMEAGLLVVLPDDVATPSAEESEQLDREIDAWFAAHPAPLRLTEAVLEDRR